MIESRKGMVLPVVVLFALLMGAFIATMSPMGRSTRTRIQNLNKNQGCFFVAQAAYAKLMAEIHRVSWQNRSFATAPYREIGQPILNGDYDLHVENTPGTACLPCVARQSEAGQPSQKICVICGSSSLRLRVSAPLCENLLLFFFVFVLRRAGAHEG